MGLATIMVACQKDDQISIKDDLRIETRSAKKHLVPFHAE